MTKNRVLVFWCFVAALTAVLRAQDAPQDFRDFIGYGASTWTETYSNGTVEIYRADGTFGTVLAQTITLTGSNPVPVIFPPTLQAGTYSYRPIDSSHGLLTKVIGGVSHDLTLSFAPGGRVASAIDGLNLYYFYRNAGREEMLNSSTRTFVAAGRSVTTGFVISGTNLRSVLIRAIGPSLANFGVKNPLTDPKIEVYDRAGNRVDFLARPGLSPTSQAALKSALAAFSDYVGAFAVPPDGGDAVTYVRLPAGVYSAVSSSISGTREGEALLEIYILP